MNFLLSERIVFRLKKKVHTDPMDRFDHSIALLGCLTVALFPLLLPLCETSSTR